MNRLLILLLATLGLSGPSFGQFNAKMSYATIEDPKGIYDGLPRSVLDVVTPSDSAAKLLFLVAREIDENALGIPEGAFSRARVGEVFALFKDRFYGMGTAMQIREMQSLNLFNCVNHIKLDKAILDYARFVGQKIDLTEMTQSRYDQMSENVEEASTKIKQYMIEHDGTCPTGEVEDPVLYERHKRKVENVFFSMFVTIHMDPSIRWVELNRKSNIKLLTGENGIWHRLATAEAYKLYNAILTSATVEKPWLEQIQATTFSDFFTFTAELRSWLSENNKSPVIAKEIGIACIDSIEAAFEPFKLGTCLESGKLQRISANDAIMLVRADDE